MQKKQQQQLQSNVRVITVSVSDKSDCTIILQKKSLYFSLFSFDLKWCFFKSMFSISLDVIIIIEPCKI
jgi:hypothetical protein